MDKVKLGQRVKEARKLCGYTQEQLSEMANIGSIYLKEPIDIGSFLCLKIKV